jgi:hypothetical protein
MIVSKKCGSIDCNERFFSTSGYTWCGAGGYMCTKGAVFYNDVKDNVNTIGNSIVNALSMSENLEYSMETMLSIKEKSKIEVLNKENYEKQIYGYKTKTELNKNRMFCDIELSASTLTIAPSQKKGLGSYVGLDKKYDIILQSDIPPELLGAAVRFAFTRCRGNGVDVVTKALFPDGVPDSLEEYLESVDPGYEKWLVRE